VYPIHWNKQSVLATTAFKEVSKFCKFDDRHFTFTVGTKDHYDLCRHSFATPNNINSKKNKVNLFIKYCVTINRIFSSVDAI